MSFSTTPPIAYSTEHVLTCINSAYNEKKYAEIFLHYRWLFIKGDIFIGEWEVFGTEVFLCYSQFFIISDFVIDGVECILVCI